MIDKKSISDIDTTSEEGKMLLAALAILTSLDKTHLKSNKFGSGSHPDSVMCEISNLANKLYYKNEYSRYVRDLKIDNIIKNPLI